MSSMTCVNLVLQTVANTWNSLPNCVVSANTTIIQLSHAWINFGKIRMLYIILKHRSTELEVAVKVCVIHVYCKVSIRCGQLGFGLRSSTPSTSTSKCICPVTKKNIICYGRNVRLMLVLLTLLGHSKVHGRIYKKYGLGGAKGGIWGGFVPLHSGGLELCLQKIFLNRLAEMQF